MMIAQEHEYRGNERRGKGTRGHLHSGTIFKLAGCGEERREGVCMRVAFGCMIGFVCRAFFLFLECRHKAWRRAVV